MVGAPFGPFSKRLASELRVHGTAVCRVILNGGDLADWGVGDHVSFRQGPEVWGEWVHSLMRERAITDLLTFGDTSHYTNAAIAEAKRLGVRVTVLEEGYFRPHWITCQPDGVNGHSAIPRDAEQIRRAAAVLNGPDEPIGVGRITPKAITAMVWHHAIRALMTPVFPAYKSGYQYSYLHQTVFHIVSYVQHKMSRDRQQHRLHAAIERAGEIFLVLLQRPGDSQLTVHSPFATTAQYIETVVQSFAVHAPKGARLVFKAHPLDHGIEPHEEDILRIAGDYGVAERCCFIVAGHLASLARCSQGCITVNSTAGLTAIEFGTPTIALGRAIFDIPGLTFQAGLDAFWHDAVRPDAQLYKDFRRVVMALTQVNGAFSNRPAVILAARGVAARLLDPPAEWPDTERSVSELSISTRASGTFAPFPERHV